MTRAKRQESQPPPVVESNPEVEAALLGTMLIDQRSIDIALGAKLSAKDFTKPAHSHIYAAIVEIYETGGNAHPLTVATKLRRMGLLREAGGDDYLDALFDADPPFEAARQFVNEVKECSLKNQHMAALAEWQTLVNDPTIDSSDVLARLERLTYQLAGGQDIGTGRLAPMSEIYPEFLEHLKRLQEREHKMTGTPTGMRELDEMLLGLQPQSLVIVGARPSMGKTAFALRLACHAAFEENCPVLFFSLEMGASELTQRMLAFEANVDSNVLKGGRKIDAGELARVEDAGKRFAQSPLYIFDNPNVTLPTIRSMCQQVRARAGDIGLVVIDYIQLIQGTSRTENRQQEVSSISRGLKILARELNAPVVAVSQLSRNLEARTDKRPMLADLRESGSLEQDADVVLFLYRDVVYNPKTEDKFIGEVIVAKHRNGPVGTIRLAWLPEYSAFTDLAGQSEAPTDTGVMIPAMAQHPSLDRDDEEEPF